MLYGSGCWKMKKWHVNRKCVSEWWCLGGWAFKEKTVIESKTLRIRHNYICTHTS